MFEKLKPYSCLQVIFRATHWIRSWAILLSKEEEKICLEEVIPGLRSGLVGMKEGEKRIVYIHPDFAYGTSGCLPPNALLTFEVELVQANAPSIEENTELKTEQEEGKKSTSELADSETHVR